MTIEKYRSIVKTTEKDNFDKGKLVERRGRKAKGLRSIIQQKTMTAGCRISIYFVEKWTADRDSGRQGKWYIVKIFIWIFQFGISLLDKYLYKMLQATAD